MMMIDRQIPTRMRTRGLEGSVRVSVLWASLGLLTGANDIGVKAATKCHRVQREYHYQLVISQVIYSPCPGKMMCRENSRAYDLKLI